MPRSTVSNTICASWGVGRAGALLAVGLLGAGCSPASMHPDPPDNHLGKAASEITWRDPQSLHPAGVKGGDRFGLSVALSESTALVSAPRSPPALPGGSVRVFGRVGAGWTDLATLAPPGLGAEEKLGQTVVLEGDTALIGSPTGIGATTPGAAYVYVRSGGTWTLDGVLTTATGEIADYFAGSVALAGDTAFVGAPFQTVGSNAEQGAVHVYRKGGSGWVEQAQITAKDGKAGDRFGGPIAASGDTVVVAAPLTNDGGDFVGAAYVLVRNGAVWTLQQKLGPAGGEAGTGFGHSVAISGDTLAIGSEHVAIAASDGGGVLVFERQNGVWGEEAVLVAGDAAPADLLGMSVALSGDRLAAGASFADAPNVDAGAVYVFDRSGGAWGQVAKLFVGSGAPADHLGSAVAVQGDTVLAGAPSADKWGFSSGAAYLFEPLLENGAPCLGGAQCTSGHCIDSVCCNSVCVTANMACSVAEKGTGEDGVCGPVDSDGAVGGGAATSGHGGPAGGTGGAGGEGGTPAASDDYSYYSCAAAPGGAGSGGLGLGAGLAMILAAPFARRRRAPRRAKGAG